MTQFCPAKVLALSGGSVATLTRPPMVTVWANRMIAISLAIVPAPTLYCSCCHLKHNDAGG